MRDGFTASILAAVGLGLVEPVLVEPVLFEPALFEPARVDPALEGRDLGPWTMIPAAISVPVALIVAAVLIWYFVRLGRGDIAPILRRVRRVGIVFALASIVPLVRALTFVHPHEDRAGWATAWAVAFLALLGWFLLALVDVVIVLQGGARDYRELRREVFGRTKENGAGDGTR